MKQALDRFGRPVVGATLVGGFLAVAVVLLWSDRAGNAFNGVVGRIYRTARRAERTYGIDLFDRSDIPAEPDRIGHALFWGFGMLLIGWVLRRKIPILLTALAVAALSLFFEITQPALSQSRGLQPADAAANLVGVAIGAAVLLTTVWLFERFNRLSVTKAEGGQVE